MVAPIDIMNAALQLAGARSIINSTTETNPEAQQLALWYNPDRLWLLRSHRWNFAREQGALTLSATAPGVDNQPATNLPWPFMPWAYSYLYPSDCVEFRGIIPTYNAAPLQPQPYTNQQPPVPFQVSSTFSPDNILKKAVFTMQSQAIACWTADIQDSTLFDPQFVEALEFLLASHVCIGLSGNQQLANALFQKSTAVIEQAKARDGVEGLTIHNLPVDWILVRGYAADYQVGAYPYSWWGGMWGGGGPYGGGPWFI